MRLKMTQKMIIFQFIFHLIFGFHFQAPLQKCFYCQQVQCDLSTCLLCHQRQGKVPPLNHSLYLCQNELKNLHWRLLSLPPSTPLTKRIPILSCSQLRSAVSPGQWPELRNFLTGWGKILWINTSFFLILQRMPRVRDEENMLQRGWSLNFTGWWQFLFSLLMLTKMFRMILL